MENIFRDVAEVEVYIDDTGISLDSREQHLAVLCMASQKTYKRMVSQSTH
jgi:hypothetical protein